MSNPIVSVVMTTFGHEEYIKEAIEGVLMQDCNFNYELIIANDCSPDNTDGIVHEILKEHARAHFVKYTRHEDNLGMLSNFMWSLKEATGEFIAICEGDDYWIDPYKLQKQVNYLRSNEGYGAVFTDTDYLYQRNAKVIRSFDKKNRLQIPSGQVTEDLLYKNLYKTCTVLFRNRNLNELFSILYREQFLLGDKPLWLFLSESMKFGYLPESTSVRRVLATSASHYERLEDNIRFRRSSFRVSIFFANRNDISLDKKAYKKIYVRSLFKYAYQNRMITAAIRHFLFRRIFRKSRCRKSIMNC